MQICGLDFVIPFCLTSFLVVAVQLSFMSMLPENIRSNAQKVLTILQVDKNLARYRARYRAK